VAKLIDLYSDTATRPSQGMLEAILRADLGDEQKGEDPSVNELQKRVAGLLGKETALFLPSATMANQIALKVHTKPGDEVILEQSAHIAISESGGPALLSGVMLLRLPGQRGMFTARQMVSGIRKDDPHCPRTSLVCVEQTSNRGGGSIWPIAQLRDIAEAAHERDIATHMDGSRLMNAVVATGVSAPQQTHGYDSVTFCLTKGLGCPVGALVAGTHEFLREARRFKHLFGGAMRQAGIVAAAGIFALENNVKRLEEDHSNARILANCLAEIRGIDIDCARVDTNLVFFDIARTGLSGKEFLHRLAERGVRMGIAVEPTLIRAATHLDVTREDVEEAARAVSAALADLPTHLPLAG
jgi:threonine aldolase